MESVYLSARTEFGDDDLITISALQSIAVHMDELGRHAEALAVKERLVGQLRRTRGADHPRTISNTGNLAFSYATLGMTGQALDTAREAMLAGQRSLGPKHQETLFLQGRYAQALLEADRRTEAAELLEATQALAVGTLAPAHRLNFDLALRHWEARNGAAREPAALRSLRAIVDDQANALGDGHPARLVALEALARAEENAGEMRAAIGTRRSLRQRVEEERSRRSLPREVRQSQLARAARGYKTLARLELDAGETSAAFASGEMAKGRTLLDSLASRRADRSGVIPSADADALAEFDERLAAVDSEIAKAPAAEQRTAVEARRNAIAREAGAFRQSLASRYPKYAQLTLVPPAAAQDRLALPANAVYLGYLVADGRVIGWVVPRTGAIRGHDLGDAATLRSAIETWRALVSSRETASAWRLPDGRFAIAVSPPERGAVRVQGASEVASFLSARLLAPFGALLRGARTWIVSPDDFLAALPIEPLPWRGRKVLDRHDLRYVQSLAVHRLLVERHRIYRADTTRASLLAVGAARYDRSDAQSSALPAPAFAAALQRVEGDVARAFDQLNMRWPDLPASEREVDAVARLFPQAVVWKRDAASEDRLIEHNRRGALAGYRYLLFSAHGYLSISAPLTSAIVLDQRAPSSGSDGYVTAAEWTGYTLKSDLVALSACETGLGGLVAGEGIIGLPYALFVAGNADAVVTLWPVLDGSTARFMQRFFARVARGEDHGRALAAVKREFAAKALTQGPLHWAGFVLYGAR